MDREGQRPDRARCEKDLSVRLGRMSDRICSLILFSDLDWIDIQIEIEKMREVAETEMPKQAEWFELIYASRFERIRRQWRPAPEARRFFPE